MKKRSPERLLQHLQETLAAQKLLSLQDPNLIAISGGPDSVFLAAALHKLGFPLALAHVNYALRGEDSHKEAELVRVYGEAWEVPVHILDHLLKDSLADSPDSLQMLARRVRYDFFYQLIRDHGYARIVTAHHADDQAETLLLSLVKGEAFSTWKGIPGTNGPVVRPLLGIYKAEILQSLESWGLKYSHDYTNWGNEYERNKVRNQWLPLMEAVNPRVKQTLLNKWQWAGIKESFLESHLKKVLQQIVVQSGQGERVNLLQLASTFPEIPVSLCVGYWAKGLGLHGHSLEQVVALAGSIPGKQVETEEGRIFRTSEGLHWTGKGVEAGLPTPVWMEQDGLEGGREIDLGRQKIYVKKFNSVNFGKYDPKRLYFDLRTLVFPIKFRVWAQGDRMVPLGMIGSKKISDILIDNKVPLPEKENQWVVEDEKGIIGLVGMGISDRVKITPLTEWVLVIEVMNPDEGQKEL